MMLTYQAYRGATIRDAFDGLATLRITVFREYPYLYEGSLAYEREYLETYARSADAFLFAAYDGEQMIGATTCIPLRDETAEVQEPFLKAGMDIERIFYFGESLLLQPYRGLGIGHRFFDAREAHAANFDGQYNLTCFCAVDRGEHHPAKPEGYRPNDAFWRKRGYAPHPTLISYFDWQDTDQAVSTTKPMIYWTKPL